MLPQLVILSVMHTLIWNRVACIHFFPFKKCRNTRSESCPFCRGSIKRVNSEDLWVLTCNNDVVDTKTLSKEDLQCFYLYINSLPKDYPDALFLVYYEFLLRKVILSSLSLKNITYENISLTLLLKEYPYITDISRVGDHSALKMASL